MKKILLLLGTALILLSSVVFAGAFTAPNVTPTAPSASGVSNAVSSILGAAQWIGFIVGIAMIIWVGVKYLTSGAGKKAEVKSTMIPILVGAALVALAPTLAGWLFNMFGGNTTGGGGTTPPAASTVTVSKPGLSPSRPATESPLLE